MEATRDQMYVETVFIEGAKCNTVTPHIVLEEGCNHGVIVEIINCFT